MRMHRLGFPGDSRGITGLETAIILIAFVVVASVFAFTVLSTGVFASERSKETIFAGLAEAKSSLETRGSVVAYKGRNGDTDTIYKVSFVVANAIAGEPIDLTPPYTTNDTGIDPDVDSASEYRTVISFTDTEQFLPDVPWTVTFLGNASDDNLLEEGEKAEITVWLLRRDYAQAITDADGVLLWPTGGTQHGITSSSGTQLVTTNDKFTVEVKPDSGSVLTVQRTAPARLDTVMDLK